MTVNETLVKFLAAIAIGCNSRSENNLFGDSELAIETESGTKPEMKLGDHGPDTEETKMTHKIDLSGLHSVLKNILRTTDGYESILNIASTFISDEISGMRILTVLSSFGVEVPSFDDEALNLLSGIFSSICVYADEERQDFFNFFKSLEPFVSTSDAEKFLRPLSADQAVWTIFALNEISDSIATILKACNRCRLTHIPTRFISTGSIIHIMKRFHAYPSTMRHLRSLAKEVFETTEKYWNDLISTRRRTSSTVLTSLYVILQTTVNSTYFNDDVWLRSVYSRHSRTSLVPRLKNLMEKQHERNIRMNYRKIYRVKSTVMKLLLIIDEGTKKRNEASLDLSVRSYGKVSVPYIGFKKQYITYSILPLIKHASTSHICYRYFLNI